MFRANTKTQKYSTTPQVMGRVVLPSCRRATLIEPRALSPPLLLLLLPPSYPEASTSGLFFKLAAPIPMKSVAKFASVNRSPI